jgi:hypothetical protein
MEEPANISFRRERRKSLFPCAEFRAWRLLLALTLLALIGRGNVGGAIRLDVFVGYDGIASQGSFFPAVFEVFNDGPTFNALIELAPTQFSQGQVRQVSVELPTGTLKRFVVPIFSSDQYRLASWNVRLFDERGKVRLETTTRQIRKNNGWSIPLLGAVTRAVPPLPEVKASNQEFKPVVARLQPNLFPDNPIGLEGLDTIYVSSEKAMDLKLNQINALMAWLHSGGHLVVGVEQLIHVNGTEWLRQRHPMRFDGFDYSSGSLGFAELGGEQHQPDRAFDRGRIGVTSR